MPSRRTNTLAVMESKVSASKPPKPCSDIQVVRDVLLEALAVAVLIRLWTAAAMQGIDAVGILGAHRQLSRRQSIVYAVNVVAERFSIYLAVK